MNKFTKFTTSPRPFAAVVLLVALAVPAHAGTRTLASDLNAGSLSISSSTFNAGSFSITAAGDLTLSSGTFNAQSSSLTALGNLSISTHTQFNAGTSTVAFNGSSQQNVWSSTHTFAIMDIRNTSSGGVRFKDSLVVSTFTALQAGTTIQFAVSPSSLSVLSSLSLGPVSGLKLGLRSAADATSWLFVLSTGATQNVMNTDVKDSDASGGIRILAYDGSSVNTGNNLNWIFGSTAPIGPVITNVYVTSMTVTWGAVSAFNGYVLEASTGAWPNSFTGNVSSSTFDGNASTLTFNSGSLSPNTTYYVRVGSLAGPTTTYALATPLSTSTLTSPITGTNISIIGVTAITVNWNVLAIGTGTNTAEGYLLQASSTNFNGAGTIFSSRTYVVALSTLTVDSLVPQTTYYLRVGGLNWNNVPNFTFVGSSPTAVVPAPTGLGGFVQGVSSINWTWGLVPSATSYNIYVASSPTTLIATNITVLPYSDINLSTNTAYGRVVTAFINGVESGLSNSATTYTLAAIPGPAVPSSVAYTSFTITWLDNGNPGYTRYEVSLSTTNDSFATNVSTPVAFGSLMAATTDLVNLNPGTTYYVRVRAENSETAPLMTDFSLTTSTVTLAGGFAIPAAVTDLTAVSTAPGAAFLSWTAPGESGQTGVITNGEFRIAYTTDTALAQSAVYWSTTTAQIQISTSGVVPGTVQYASTSLFGGATYYFRLWTQNSVGNWSALSNGATVQTWVFAPTNLNVNVLGTTSMTWTWSDANNLFVDSYRTRDGANTIVNTIPMGTFLSTEINLSTNTAYTRKVEAFTGTTSSTTVALARFTDAAAPTGSVASGVFLTNITVQWNANDNPVGTHFIVDFSSAAGFGTLVTSDTLDTQAGFTGLTSNTTYYLRVRAKNGDGVFTPYDTLVTTVTPAAVPVSGSFSVVTSTSITISWGASTNESGTQYQAELSTISAVGAATQTVVTSGLSTQYSGLTADTTYYARVKALGWSGADSLYLIIGSTITPMSSPTNVVFSMVELSSITVSWTGLGGANLEYKVQLTSAGPFAVAQTSFTSTTSATFTGLSVNLLYGAKVQTHNTLTGNYSSATPTISTYTLAMPPVTLSTTAVTAVSVSLTWDANGNPNPTTYSIERSSDAISFTAIASQTATTFTDITVNGGSTYSYRVRALNGNNIPTAYTNVVTVTTLGTLVAPRVPGGLWGARDPSGTQVTYKWTQVTQRTDGSPLTNLAGYRVYQSNTVLTPRSSWALVATVAGETWTTTTTASSVNYYSLKTVDANGMESDYSQIMDDSADLNHFYLSADGVSRVQLTQLAANVLLRANNVYTADITIVPTEMSSEEVNRVVRSFDMKLIRDDNDLEVTNLEFTPPVLRATLHYTVMNGQVMQGAPARAPVLSAADATTGLSLFWYNGVEWIKSSGQTSTADQTISVTTAHAGRFQIRVAARTSSITITKVYPRIITPNGDGWNDKVIFQFDNPQLLNLSGKIYDLSGALVANCVPGPDPDSTLMWDGKDSGGRVVPGGIYLYQVDLQGQTLTGTIVVAR